jgi:hypothetical protein
MATAGGAPPSAGGLTLDTLPPFALALALSHPSLILSDLVCVRSLCRSLRAAAPALAPMEQAMWEAVRKVGDLPSHDEMRFNENPEVCRCPHGRAALCQRRRRGLRTLQAAPPSHASHGEYAAPRAVQSDAAHSRFVARRTKSRRLSRFTPTTACILR